MKQAYMGQSLNSVFNTLCNSMHERLNVAVCKFFVMTLSSSTGCYQLTCFTSTMLDSFFLKEFCRHILPTPFNWLSHILVCTGPFIPGTQHLRCRADILLLSATNHSSFTTFKVKMYLTFMAHCNAVTAISAHSIWCSVATQCRAFESTENVGLIIENSKYRPSRINVLILHFTICNRQMTRWSLYFGCAPTQWLVKIT